ncbi:hypothetical protein M0Q97_07055 [Candidatus Dojkabacteria bacterium]|jgi:hypothetical protein|nr:hypothetical protein [Candidatus Dojkabacteria bacterium]
MSYRCVFNVEEIQDNIAQGRRFLIVLTTEVATHTDLEGEQFNDSRVVASVNSNINKMEIP